MKNIVIISLMSILFLTGCGYDHPNHNHSSKPTTSNELTVTKIDVSSTRVYLYGAGGYTYIVEIEFKGHLYNLIEDEFMMHSPNCKCLLSQPQKPIVALPGKKITPKTLIHNVPKEVGVPKSDVVSFQDKEKYILSILQGKDQIPVYILLYN